MFKTILIAAVLVVIFNAVFVFSGGLDLLVKQDQEERIKVEKIDPDIVDVFRFTLEDEVLKKIGQPIEGYEPQMFLEAFSGLTETDFAGVSAVIGTYEVLEGRLEHRLGDTKQPIHSAATAIDKEGYETLLNNVANRAAINLKGSGTITDVMSVIVGD